MTPAVAHRRVRSILWSDTLCSRVAAALMTCIIASAARTSADDACTGDCDGVGTVTIDEIVLGVNILLGKADHTQCTRMDRNVDRTVSIDEIVAAVGSLLSGCTDCPTSIDQLQCPPFEPSQCEIANLLGIWRFTTTIGFTRVEDEFSFGTFKFDRGICILGSPCTVPISLTDGSVGGVRLHDDLNEVSVPYVVARRGDLFGLPVAPFEFGMKEFTSKPSGVSCRDFFFDFEAPDRIRGELALRDVAMPGFPSDCALFTPERERYPMTGTRMSRTPICRGRDSREDYR